MWGSRPPASTSTEPPSDRAIAIRAAVFGLVVAIPGSLAAVGPLLAVGALVGGLVLAASGRVRWRSFSLSVAAAVGAPLLLAFSVLGLYAAVLLSVGVAGELQSRLGSSFDIARSDPVKSHLTIYVAPPLLTEGGAVVVAAIPIDEEEWRALDGLNLADEDPDNAKRPQLGANDRLFGVRAESTATIIELFYPETGTYGFNFVPARDAGPGANLRTERILIGSGGWSDYENDIVYQWPDVSTVHVDGPASSENRTRALRVEGGDLMRLRPARQDYAGANVYQPTSDQIERALQPDLIQ